MCEVLLGLLRLELRESVLEFGDGVVPEVGRGREVVPAFCFVGLGLELVDTLADVLNLVTAPLLGFVRGLKGLELVLDVGDGFAGFDETFLGGFVLLALEGVDLDLKLELATLKLVNSLGSSFTSYANTIGYTLVKVQYIRKSQEAYLAHASSTKSIAESGRRLDVR